MATMPAGNPPTTGIAHQSGAPREAAAEIGGSGPSLPGSAPNPRSAQSNDRERKLVRFDQSRLFQGLSAGECTAVCSRAEVRHYLRGEKLFRRGDPVCSIALLLSGRVKIMQIGPDGSEVILGLSLGGDVVGCVGAKPSSVHASTAEAVEPSQALVWDARVLEGLAQHIPTLQRNAVRLLLDRLETIEERFRELATEQVASRLARMVLRLMEQIGHRENGSVRIAISREDLAQMTGTTLFTVSRLLSEWEERGIVGARRQAVLILDPAGLTDIIETCAASTGERQSKAPRLARRSKPA